MDDRYAAERGCLMPVNKDQAEMLAALATAARPHGARRWDAPGVIAALGKVRHLDLAEVLMAVGRAARDRDLATPAAIGNPSAPCWIEKPVERWMPDKTTPEFRCGICGKGRAACENGPRFADDDHRFEPDFKVRNGSAVDELRDVVASARDRIQGDLTPTAATPPTHTTEPEEPS